MGPGSITTLRKQHIKKAFPARSADSHKGQNGKVLIVGGSIEYYGAPLLSALGSLYTGADLVYVLFLNRILM